ncbi:Fe-S cluster assembly protein SufD [uncultured Halovibrio sp.]|uniref:Fe-S cluster assembly protein SufD n=1 Tax=uncultured Halovibrio sp. TaxID=985049 RepID=UPI0025D512A9|nr:Fe-S cluster assembly protein SufD [uncultured Halovibrio sp.]
MTLAHKTPLTPLDDAFTPEGGKQLPAPLKSLRDIRSKAITGMALPNRRTENWKYSSRYLKLDPELAPQTQATGDADYRSVEGVYRLVIRNGVVDLDSSNLPSASGVDIRRFVDLDDVAAQSVAKKLDTTLDHGTTQLAALNTARLEDGVLIRLSADTSVDKPVYIQYVTDAGASGSNYPRVMVEAGQGSKMTLVEEYISNGDQPVLVDSVSELLLDDSANITYIRLCMDPANVRHIGATGVKVGANAKLDSHCIGFGGDLRRHDLQVRLEGQGGYARLNGIALTQDRQHYDNHTAIDHVVPNCDSDENYRCLAADRSHAIFNGRIHIHPDAQQSHADMNNKNLLLSTNAEIDTKPELEIYADDVTCAHGATVGQLDEGSLFYLTSRGIDRDTAATMLSMAFVHELVGQVPLEDIREAVNTRLTDFIEASFRRAAE